MQLAGSLSTESMIRAASVAKAAMGTIEGSSLELELRFGRIVNGNFCPGVDPEWFETITNRLSRCTDWTEVHEWAQMDDLRFEHNGVEIRQRRVANPRECTVNLETVVKTSVCREDFVVASNPDPQMLAHMIGSEVTAIRISCALERPIDCDTLPLTVVPTYVRAQQRVGFMLASTSVPGAGWNFHCSRTWWGVTHEAAARSQRTGVPTCEVEVEWIPPARSSVLPDPLVLVESLLSKASALLYH